MGDRTRGARQRGRSPPHPVGARLLTHSRRADDAQENTTTTTVDLASDRAHEALARRFYVPFNTGEVDLYDTLLAPDWVDDPLAPGQRPGPAGLTDLVAGFRAVVPDYHVTNDKILVARDRVAVHSTVRGTHRGTLFGVPATGHLVTLRTCDFHRIANGNIGGRAGYDTRHNQQG